MNLAFNLGSIHYEFFNRGALKFATLCKFKKRDVSKLLKRDAFVSLNIIENFLFVKFFLIFL